MNILTNEEIQEAIKRCKPCQIAVAYIGIDWHDFIPVTTILEAVIVSPTIGMNPKAIVALAKAIGWDKLFFLNELHAKIYLGRLSAIVGSANLTQNGLSGHTLIELCVEINSETGVKEIGRFLTDLKSRAQNLYPTTERKKAQIRELERTWNAAIANRIICLPPNRPDKSNNFTDFEHLGEDHFYVCWYQDGDFELADDLKAIENEIQDQMHFAKSDNVKTDKWILTWRINNQSLPFGKVRPEWMYIHEVYDDGVIKGDDDYPKCAIERSDKVTPEPPFELTSEVENAFKRAVIENDVAKYLIQSNRKIFSLKHSLQGIPTLLSRMREYLK